MPVGKKTLVAVSVFLAGGSAAFLFRKDAFSKSEQEASLETPFREHVERRLSGGAATGPVLTPPRRRLIEERGSGTPRVPPATSISDREGPVEDAPTFHKSFHPVGSLLEPVEGVAAEELAAQSDQLDDMALDSESPPATTHTIVDGDTLSGIAQKHLGRADRYLEIFALNRGVLSNVDLLPIGAILKLPPRHQSTRPEKPADMESPSTDGGASLERNRSAYPLR